MKDKVIELARQAGARDNGSEFLFNELRYLERFYNLVRAEYRKEIGNHVAVVYEYGRSLSVTAVDKGRLCHGDKLYKLPGGSK